MRYERYGLLEASSQQPLSQYLQRRQKNVRLWRNITDDPPSAISPEKRSEEMTGYQETTPDVNVRPLKSQENKT